MNRDWRNKPIQGGSRDAYWYGHAELEPVPSVRWSMAKYAFGVAMFMFAVLVASVVIECVCYFLP